MLGSEGGFWPVVGRTGKEVSCDVLLVMVVVMVIVVVVVDVEEKKAFRGVP